LSHTTSLHSSGPVMAALTITDAARVTRGVCSPRMTPSGEPAVQIDQGGAQQGPVVDRVGPVLTTRVVCSADIDELEIARGMLCPRQVVDVHRLQGD
jgi:hypothetical protein